jgi:uncharacterized protein YjbI with pentapeptide repeats
MDSTYMGRCSYTWEALDRVKSKFVVQYCQKKTWKGSDEFCIFHDPSSEKDIGLFREKLKKQIQSETTIHNFIGYHFPEKWSFSDILENDADFSESTFHGDVDFRRTTFQGNAYFNEADFCGMANFVDATFQGDANFVEANFHRRVSFGTATFQDDVSFMEATFCRDANFDGTAFQGNADFEMVTFCGDASFSGSIFQKRMELTPRSIISLDLGRAKFLFQGHITADLSKAFFQGSFIENVAFTGCTWPKDNVIYEEEHMNDKVINMSYADLETIYRDLKQNMQRHGHYSQAGEFYYREMEMRRKGTSKINRLWLEIYRFLAGYGEKPYLVVRNSFLVILLAAILFFFCGVARVGTELPPQENPDIINCSIHSLNLSIETLKDFGYCLYFSIVTFTTLGYGDIHPLGWSHIIAAAEALIGAFFMALFVLVFGRKMMR